MNKSLQKFNAAVPIGNLDAYVAQINQIPILTLEQERELACRYYYHQDLEAAKQLVLPHLRFVVSIARTYLGYGLALADLVQEGNIGLMKAVKRFNPEMGVRLVSFAIHWIKAEIHEFILRNWRIVKVATTKAQRKLFFNLRKATKSLTWFSHAEKQAVAQELNVSPEDVALMEQRMNAHDHAFDDFKVEDNYSSLAPEDYLEDSRYSPDLLLENKDWAANRERLLQENLALLDQRSRDILHRRWLAQEKATLHELAAEYGISAERIRQIEKMAMDKLKKALIEE